MRSQNLAVKSVSALGASALETLASFGRFWIFSLNAMSYIPIDLASRRGWRRLLPQCYYIGTRSVPVVMLTGMFVGMVLVVQGFEQFDAAGLIDRLGGIVNISVASEFGPVLAGVMLAGRVGGALTAELGTMNVTEQLLALRSMGTDPIHFLVTPRFLACLLLTPLLTAYADLMGALGAWAIYSGVFGADSEAFWRDTAESVELWRLTTGMIKALFFGGAIGCISCFRGFNCRAGAEGVGRACTEAFVMSFIVILVLDFFLNLVMNGLYEIWFGFQSLIQGQRRPWKFENPIVELRRLTKSFGRQRVLDDIDLKVERGQATVIIGRSGTGKSVLLKHIVGLLRPDRGEVYFEGQRIDELRERQWVPIRQQIGYVFQLNALFDSMTVLENVAFPMYENNAGRVSRKIIRELACRRLEQVGLKGFESKRPADLSGGEKKRVAVARAIAIEPPPKVILYDEPTAGLDPQRSDVINKLIRQLQREVQVTGVVVTHDMKLASEVGDRILMLWNGRFLADGTPAQVLRSKDEHVRRFIEGVAEPEDIAVLTA